MSHTNANEIDCCMVFLRLLAEDPDMRTKLVLLGQALETDDKLAAGAMLTSAGLAKLLSSGHRIIIVEPKETQDEEIRNPT